MCCLQDLGIHHGRAMGLLVGRYGQAREIALPASLFATHQTHQSTHQVRIPHLRRCLSHNFILYRIVRIDFNHQFLDYFTEIDGVMLIGKKFNCAKFPGFHQFTQDRSLKGPIQRKLEKVKFKPRHVDDSENYLNDYLIKDLENFLTNIESEIEAPDDCETAQFTLQHMPVRIIFGLMTRIENI